MHNKLFVGDNAIAITGGRNIGDEYFQASSELEFGDFDLAVAGPMVRDLSGTFDLFWNDRLAIPVEAQPLGKPSATDLEKARAALAEHREKSASSVYVSTLGNGDQLAEMLSGKRRLVWAPEGWENLPVERLWVLCRVATHITKPEHAPN